MAMLMTNMSISLADNDVDQFCYVHTRVTKSAPVKL